MSTSGSTGMPKGVVLKHRNLFCGTEAIAEGSNITAEDIFMSWLPLTHNMGLIGLYFTPISSCSSQIFMPASLFLYNPLSWFIIVSKFRVSRIAGPNFAYRVLIKLLRNHEILDVDLSCIKEVYNGSEPVSMSLIRELNQELKEYNLPQEAFYPVYGMAEATVAITFPKPFTITKSVLVDRRFLNIGEPIQVLDDSKNSNAVEFAKLGYPLKYNELKIMDEHENVLGENYVGIVYKRRINLKGYYGEEQSICNEDGWYCTGDVGFIHQGELVISGRKKEIIFVCGQNFYPSDVERICCEETNLEPDSVVACGFFNIKRK